MYIKTDQISQTLPLAIQIMRARAAEYLDAHITNPEARAGVYDNYTAWCVYDACATMLAEALDGNYDVLVQFIGDSHLPRIPANPCEVCEQKETCPPGTLWVCKCTRWSEWSSAIAQSDQETIVARHRSDPEAPKPGESTDPTCPCIPCAYRNECIASRSLNGKMSCTDYAAWKRK